MKRSSMRKDTAQIKRINMAVPLALAHRVSAWRRRQADLPNMSEAIRRLIEIGLEQQPGG